MSLTLINKDEELLKEIERDVQYIRDITYELNELVNKQNEPLNNLENSIMNIDKNIIMSENCLKNADDDDKNYNKKKLLVGLTSSIVITSILVSPYISIPIGLVSLGGYMIVSKFI
jgi:t-SNARE complex subunit (syntaxin)